MGRRFEAYGDAIMRHPFEGGPFYVVRRDRGHYSKVAPIAFFHRLGYVVPLDLGL